MHLRCFNELTKKCQLMQELCEFQEKSTQQQTRRILGIKKHPFATLLYSGAANLSLIVIKLRDNTTRHHIIVLL